MEAINSSLETLSDYASKKRDPSGNQKSERHCRSWGGSVCSTGSTDCGTRDLSAKNILTNIFFIIAFFLVILQSETVLWCNGSTTDSGPVCPGSSPGKTTNYTYNPLYKQGGVIFFENTLFPKYFPK